MRDVTGAIVSMPQATTTGMPSLAGFSENGTELGKLDTMLWEYCEGVRQNLQIARQNNGVLDPALQNVLAGVSKSIPGATQAIQLASKLKGLIDNTFGAGSVIGRMADVFFHGNVLTNPLSVIKEAFSGRTYRFENYQLGTIYSFHVLGKDIGDTNHVTDALVIESAKYFIDRLGVFINSSTVLYALVDGLNGTIGSAMTYMKLVNQNPFITTDPQRVNAALLVCQTYMPNDNSVLGNWSQTIGVYDRELIALANQGYNNYGANLAALKQNASSGQTDFLNSEISSSPNFIIYVIIAIVILFIIISIARA